MHKHLFGGTLMIALLAPLAAARWATPVPLTLQPESRIWVEGTSSVRSFKCTAVGVETSIDAASPDVATALAAGTHAVRTVEVRVPAAKLDCNNGTMNGHLRKAIKAVEHPVIQFRLASYELAPKEGGSAVTMTGTLSLGGAEKSVTVKADAVAGADGALRVTGSFPLRLTEYGLKPPSLMMGTMKVGDQVTVKYDLALK
jgi:polyisoprenoid-binding protein YceI